ncbi:uncharacterized protein ARMOST_21026 [Armillaria ostoyae]|uniref:Uncharacterized protein n=1 Tax=Armillaria ostoyae TaxID=47428 RepID=A0A284S8Z8_ARMOS|nr:uncharacterized protein ARMOST_21026 [Armillaria ostoyae]
MVSPAWLSTLLVFLVPSHVALHLNISRWKPSTAVRDFTTTVDEAMSILDDHKLLFRRSKFKAELLKFKLRSLTLSQELRVADRAFSWWNCRSWLKYISMMKKVFEGAREGQRGVDAVRGDMEVGQALVLVSLPLWLC